MSLLTKLKTMLLDDDDALFFDFVVVESLLLTFVGGDLGGEIACGFVTFSSLNSKILKYENSSYISNSLEQFRCVLHLLKLDPSLDQRLLNEFVGVSLFNYFLMILESRLV